MPPNDNAFKWLVQFQPQQYVDWEESVADWLASGQVGLLPFVPFLKGATIDDLEPVAEALQEIPIRCNATVPSITRSRLPIASSLRRLSMRS